MRPEINPQWKGNSRPLSRRNFVENSALAFGLGSLVAAAKGYGAETPSPSAMQTAGQVNARQYGVKGDGSTDDTEALQAALEAAKANAPVCFLPPGLHCLKGPLVVPPGVTLCGASGGVPHSEHPVGTVLLAFGGRGQPEGEPLITLKPNAVVRRQFTRADRLPFHGLGSRRQRGPLHSGLRRALDCERLRVYG